MLPIHINWKWAKSHQFIKKTTPATKKGYRPSVFFLQYLKYLRENYSLKFTITSMRNYLIIYVDCDKVTAHNILYCHCLENARNPLIKMDPVVLHSLNQSSYSEITGMIFYHPTISWVIWQEDTKEPKLEHVIVLGKNLFLVSHHRIYCIHPRALSSVTALLYWCSIVKY